MADSLTSRQKLLYGAVIVIGALYVSDIGYRKLYQEPMADAERQVTALRDRLNKQKVANAKAKRVGDQVERLQQIALPRDLELARSSYQAWLLQLVHDCELGGPRVDSGDPSSLTYRRELLYNRFVFTVRGQGNLRQITQLLHGFYLAGHLHKIQSLSLTPNNLSDQLDVSMTIEALSLPGADRESDLTARTSDRLASADLSAYRSIANRNLFQVGGDHIGRQVRLSAITRDRLGRQEAWFTNRRDDKTHRLKTDETLSIGIMNIRVVDIQDKSALLLIDDQTYRVPIGASLADGRQE